MRTVARILLLCAVPLSACADIAGGGGITGTYGLMAVNGAPLPFTTYTTGPVSPVYSNRTVSGTLTLRDNQKFVIHLTAQLLKDGAVTNTLADSANGTFALNGSTVTYTYGYPSSGTRTGSIDGRTLTMDAEGNLYSFKK